MSDSAISTDLPVRRRRRPPLSCEQCRKRKIRCDRNVPCSHCVRSKSSSVCTYAPAHIPKARRQRRPDSTSASRVGQSPIQIRPRAGAGAPLTEASTSEQLTPSSIFKPVTGSISPKPVVDAQSAASDCDLLLARVNELERRLDEANREPGTSTEKDQVTHSFSSVPRPLVSKGIISKTRYFGQSHWMTGATLFPIEISLFGREEKQQGQLYQCLSKCKVLGRKIKASRLKPLSSLDLGNTIPSKAVADGLVDAYLRTFEGVLRIVHIPTFRAEYDRYWQNPSVANEAFVILLQLCMALGTVFHDDVLSMKAKAIGWIYEAQMWLMLPPEKSRMTLVGIQITCLLTLAKSVCAVGQDLTWVMAGSLVRSAMYMGLHRDPRHLAEMTTYRAEMRRRLWATILELNLQCSFEAGGLPLITPDQYDTLPPLNLNDEQLTDEPDGTYASNLDSPSQTLVQRELLKSIPLRLRLLQHVNDFRYDQNYEATLRLNSGLIQACREFSQNVPSSAVNGADGGSSNIVPFHISLAEVFLYRCIQALHLPVLCTSFEDPRYYFSRRMCLDSALKLTHLWGFSKPRGRETLSDFRRATTNGSGLFRNVPVQSVFVLSIEVTQDKMGGSTGLGYLPTVGESDVHAYLGQALEWTLDRVRAGEVSAKGPCFLSACLGHAEALEKGLNRADTEALILQRATESTLKSWDELNAMARKIGVVAEEDVNSGENSMQENTTDELVAGWDNGWVWDEADGLSLGGPWAQCQLPLDDDLNKFFGNYN